MIVRSLVAMLSAFSFVACRPVEPGSGVGEEPSPTRAEGRSPEATQAPPSSATERSFGAPFREGTPEIALSRLVDDPEPHLGRSIRTRGRVHRVCQRRGCWMELASEGVEPIRVPMAGHAFFLPTDSKGAAAWVEGIVRMRELERSEREHLAAEGATATERTLELVATSVRLERTSTTSD